MGSGTSIGDNATIHVAKIQGDHATVIGADSIIGSGAIIHAATVGDRCLIMEGAQVLDGAVVGNECIITAGSVVTPGVKLEGGAVYSGVPAKMVRKVNPGEILAQVTKKSEEIARLAGVHAFECAKDYKTIEEDDLRRTDMDLRDPDYFQPQYTGEIVGDDEVLGQSGVGRIYNNTLLNPEVVAKAAKQKKTEEAKK